MKFLIVLALVVVAINADSTQPEGCRKGLCRMYCENGFARDADGCFQCKCNKDVTRNSDKRHYVDDQSLHTKDKSLWSRRNIDRQVYRLNCASAPMCLMYCKNGFARGLDGCFDCKCNKDLSHCEGRVMCAMFCEKGFLKGMDGCDICKCA